MTHFLHIKRNIISSTSSSSSNHGNNTILRRHSLSTMTDFLAYRSTKKYAKSQDLLNQAFINDKENDPLEYYDRIVLQEDEDGEEENYIVDVEVHDLSNGSDNVFNTAVIIEEEDEKEEEKRIYDRILYLPKPANDKDIDYKKKYQLLQQRYQRRENRILEVRQMILDGKKKSKVLQRLNGILSCKTFAANINDDLANDTVHLIQHEQPPPPQKSSEASILSISSPDNQHPSNNTTIEEFGKEFERLKANMEKEKQRKDSFKNIIEEYKEKLSKEEAERQSLQQELNEKNEEIEALKAQLAAEEINKGALLSTLNSMNTFLKSHVRYLDEVQNWLL